MGNPEGNGGCQKTKVSKGNYKITKKKKKNIKRGGVRGPKPPANTAQRNDFEWKDLLC